MQCRCTAGKRHIAILCLNSFWKLLILLPTRHILPVPCSWNGLDYYPTFQTCTLALDYIGFTRAAMYIPFQVHIPVHHPAITSVFYNTRCKETPIWQLLDPGFRPSRAPSFSVFEILPVISPICPAIFMFLRHPLVCKMVVCMSEGGLRCSFLLSFRPASNAWC